MGVALDEHYTSYGSGIGSTSLAMGVALDQPLAMGVALDEHYTSYGSGTGATLH